MSAASQYQETWPLGDEKRPVRREQTLRKHLQPQVDWRTPRFPSQMPDINLSTDLEPGSDFRSEKEWDGVVTELLPNCFKAIVSPVGADKSYGQQIVTVPLKSLCNSELNFVQLGAIFRLAAGEIAVRRPHRKNPGDLTVQYKKGAALHFLRSRAPNRDLREAVLKGIEALRIPDGIGVE